LLHCVGCNGLVRVVGVTGPDDTWDVLGAVNHWAISRGIINIIYIHLVFVFFRLILSACNWILFL
jgi:hypothetical protein